jgi:CRP-like cAMP-binding protein
MAARRFMDSSLPENRLLRALPFDEYDRLRRRMDEVILDLGDGVYRASGPIRHVYFPRSGILSKVIDMVDGGTVEIATIGREGVAGLPVFHGVEKSPFRVYCQLPPCACLRMPADVFSEESERPGAFRSLLNHYTHARFCQTAQTAACNRLHPLEQRLARWLLMTRDRVGTGDLHLTQQVLAEMLGVRRPSVTLALGILQSSGLILCSRGRILLRDHAKLEAASCECYRAVRDAFDRFLPPIR